MCSNTIIRAYSVSYNVACATYTGTNSTKNTLLTITRMKWDRHAHHATLNTSTPSPLALYLTSTLHARYRSLTPPHIPYYCYVRDYAL